MKKFNKITNIVLWVVSILTAVGIGIYNIADANACIWAWFVPAIMVVVSGLYTGISAAVSFTLSKKAKAKLVKNY